MIDVDRSELESFAGSGHEVFATPVDIQPGIINAHVFFNIWVNREPPGDVAGSTADFKDSGFLLEIVIQDKRPGFAEKHLIHE